MSLYFDGERTNFRLRDIRKLGLIGRSFTVECWICVEDFDPEFRVLMRKREDFEVLLTPKDVIIRFPEVDIKAPVPGGIEREVWYHLAFSYERRQRNFRVFLNGQMILEEKRVDIEFRQDIWHVSEWDNEATEILVGTDPVRGENHFKGWLAELRFWSIARRPEDINAMLYKRLPSSTPELRAYYPMQEGGGYLLMDQITLGMDDIEVRGVEWRDFRDQWSSINELQNQSVAYFSESGNRGSAYILHKNLPARNPDFSRGLAFEIWLRTSDMTNWSTQVIVRLADEDGAVIELLLHERHALEIRYEDPSADRSDGIVVRDVLGPGDWTPIGFSIFNDGSILLVVHGKDTDVEFTVRMDIAQKSWSTVQLGGDKHGAHSSISAELSEFRLWQRALTADELKLDDRIRKRVSGAEDDLLVYMSLGYPFGVPLDGYDPFAHVEHPLWRPDERMERMLGEEQSFVAQFTPGARILIPDVGELRIRGKLTLEAWVKPQFSPEGSAGQTYPVISRFEEEAGWQLGIRPSGIYFLLGLEDQLQEISYEIDVVAGAWYHIAGVYDSINQYLYVNGVPVASRRAEGNIRLARGGVVIGAGSEDNPQTFQGEMAEIRIWSIGRKARNLAAFRHTSIWEGDGLVACWPLADPGIDFEELEDGRIPLGIAATSSQDTFSGKAFGLASVLTTVPLVWRPTQKDQTERWAENQRDIQHSLNTIFQWLSVLPIDLRSTELEEGIREVARRLEQAGDVNVQQELDAAREALEIQRAEVLSLQDQLEANAQTFATLEETLRSQIQALENLNEGKAISFDHFIKNLHSSVTQTQQNLAQSKEVYQLQNVEMDLKVLMVDDGTGVKFPENFADVNTANLSTLHLKFSPNEALQSISTKKETVPDLRGLTEALARRTLTQLGLGVKVKQQAIVQNALDKTSRIGRVVNQIPKPGGQLPAGGTVNIYLGKAS